MNRPRGMHPKAWKAYIQACADAGVSPQRVTQTLGSAPASAGTHGKDGSFENENGVSERYSAAVDLSVKNTRLTKAQRDGLLLALWSNGYAAWYRQAPEFPGNEHIHAIYQGVPMKRSLRDQSHSFYSHRSGLVSDKADQFIRDNLTDATEQKLRALFLSCNPVNG